MNFRVLLRVSFVFSAFVLLSISVFGSAHVTDEVLQELNKNGVARVCVFLYNDMPASGSLEERKTANEMKQDAVLSALQSSQFNLYGRLKYTPEFYGTITSEGLEIAPFPS